MHIVCGTKNFCLIVVDVFLSSRSSAFNIVYAFTTLPQLWTSLQFEISLVTAWCLLHVAN